MLIHILPCQWDASVDDPTVDPSFYIYFRLMANEMFLRSSWSLVGKWYLFCWTPSTTIGLAYLDFSEMSGQHNNTVIVQHEYEFWRSPYFLSSSTSRLEFLGLSVK